MSMPVMDSISSDCGFTMVPDSPTSPAFLSTFRPLPSTSQSVEKESMVVVVEDTWVGEDRRIGSKPKASIPPVSMHSAHSAPPILPPKMSNSYSTNKSISQQTGAQGNAGRLWEINRQLLSDLTAERSRCAQLEGEVGRLKHQLAEIQLNQSLPSEIPIQHTQNDLESDYSMPACEQVKLETTNRVHYAPVPLRDSIFTQPSYQRGSSISQTEAESQERMKSVVSFALNELNRCRDEMKALNQILAEKDAQLRNLERSRSEKEEKERESLETPDKSSTSSDSFLPPPHPLEPQVEIHPQDQDDSTSEPEPSSLAPPNTVNEDLQQKEETEPEIQAFAEEDEEDFPDPPDFAIVAHDRICPICGQDFQVFDGISQANFEDHADICAEQNEPGTLVPSTPLDTQANRASTYDGFAYGNLDWTCPVCTIAFPVHSVTPTQFEAHIKGHYRGSYPGQQ